MIRGDATSPPQTLFWPTTVPGGNASHSGEVLVDWQFDEPGAPLPTTGIPPPWDQNGADFAELFDGFTLQGGNVQMLVGDIAAPAQQFEVFGRISNCVFDMRDHWTTSQGTTVIGPQFGLMFVSQFDPSGGTIYGYLDRQFVIANNTFIMAEFAKPSSSAAATWINSCRPDAVALIDVTNPTCTSSPSGFRDPDTTLRGVSNLLVINNLFRTQPLPSSPPPGTKPMAMLGIDAGDTAARLGSIGGYSNTNIFDPERVGADNGVPTSATATFTSAVRTSLVIGMRNTGLLVDDKGNATIPPFGTCNIVGPVAPNASLPVPGRPLWNGHNQTSGGIDPGFVGEYLNLVMTPPTPYYAYRDWRLLPSSPAADLGISMQGGTATQIEGSNAVNVPPPFQGVTMTYTESGCLELQTFRWDGEGHGNPRVVNGAVDVGFDEIGSLIVAGSWANDSNSHNRPSPLNPSSSQAVPTRYFIFSDLFSGSNVQITLHGTQRVLAALPVGSAPSSWTVPPGALPNPAVDPNKPADYQLRYINLSDPSGQQLPTPWTFAAPQFSFYSPIGGATSQQLKLVAVPQVDDEGVGTGVPPYLIAYFNLQATLTNDKFNSGLIRWSNVQSEYR